LAGLVGRLGSRDRVFAGGLEAGGRAAGCGRVRRESEGGRCRCGRFGGRGTADEWSDLELDIYWHAPPTDDDRRRPIERLDGRIERFWDFSEHEEEWGEEYALGDLGVSISSFLVDSARRFIDLGACMA
jgi:hypothetical protein